VPPALPRTPSSSHTHPASYALRNFSEEELVDCIGWDKDQFGYFGEKGFMDTAIYPYNTTGPDMDPPIPGHPCLYDQKKVIKGTDGGKFNNMTGAAPSEDQLVVRCCDGVLFTVCCDGVL